MPFGFGEHNDNFHNSNFGSETFEDDFKSNIRLETLYLDNFKSFKRSKFEFGKLNCLIAPNNTGKSNLMVALKFLDNLIYHNAAVAIASVGGAENIRNFHYDENETKVNARFRIKNRVLHLNEFIDYDIYLNFLYSIDFESKQHNIDVIVSGKIKSVIIEGSDLVSGYERIIGKFESNIKNYDRYVDVLNGQNYRSFDFTYNHNTKQYSLNTRFDSTKKMIENLFILKIDKSDKEKLELFLNFSNIFSKNSLFSSYYFQSHEMKKPQVLGKAELSDNGKNLPEYLVSLYKRDKELFEDISTSLIGEVELVNSIEVRDSLIPELVFKEEVNDKTHDVSIQNISDGTLHFIAIMSALLGNRLSQGIMIEEPERHMHMKVLSYILNTMRDDDKQIFFTTHSGELLRILNQDEIIFLYRDEDTGDTKGLSASKIESLDKIFKKYKYELSDIIKNEVLGYLGDYNG